MAYSKSDNYPFLNERLAREAYVEEILSEIEAVQKIWQKTHSGELATVEYLNESRNIKMPLTQKRLMNIQYLIDQIIKAHPEYLKPVYSFSFSIIPETKNLNIEEKMELTLMMTDADLHALQEARDATSTENLLRLLQNFRLFNLTKLIKKSKNRNQLSQVIKDQLGKTIFTFKNYSCDKRGLETTEDFCFHRDNYEAVKNKIEIDSLKKIIEQHVATINRRLKNLGILNPYISDYRDSKIDYIINLFTTELAPLLDKNDLLAVKNFQSLRDCINKVDKILDPIVLLDSDIMNYIKNHFMTTDRDITGIFKDFSPEVFTKWENEKATSGKILLYTAHNGINYIFDPAQFYSKYNETLHFILYSQDFAKLEQHKREEKLNIADIMTDAGKKILSSNELALKTFGSDENITDFKNLAKEYEVYKKASEKDEEENPQDTTRKSIIAAILSGIVSLFVRKDKEKYSPSKIQITSATKITKVARNISKETRNLYEQIKDRKSPLIPLSEFIEIIPENEQRIEQIINELRDNNLKIIVPIYNARQVLYPIKSKKYLIADVEYLLIDPETASSPEEIREYIEQITGFKFKDDVISGNALFSIEKYLFSIHRQNKAKKRREKLQNK